MDHTSVTTSPTFCPAPWTGLNIDQAGHVSPCFHCVEIVGNNKKDTIQDIIHGPILTNMRETMARGEWHSGCSWCKSLEETTGASGRTVRYADQSILTEIDNNLDFFKLEHLVVNWSNLCNLSCVYCNPETSTAWQSVKKIPINHIKNEHEDLIELAKTQGHNIQGLSLGGGEPLLQKGLGEFLDYLDPNKVNVMVTTNLSIDITTNAIYQKLKSWPRVEWMVSFDNADAEQFEYVRNGARWATLIANLDIMQQDAQTIKAHPAYSIYNAFDLVSYYEFCTNRSLEIFWCELTNPWDLDARRLPKAMRLQAVAKIDQVIERWGQHIDLGIHTLQNYRKQLLDNTYIFNINEYQPNVLSFHQQIEIELNKATRFVDLWPELAEGVKHGFD